MFLWPTCGSLMLDYALLVQLLGDRELFIRKTPTSCKPYLIARSLFHVLELSLGLGFSWKRIFPGHEIVEADSHNTIPEELMRTLDGRVLSRNTNPYEGLGLI